MATRTAFFVFLLALSACSANSTGPGPVTGIHVLFIGNSLTASNDLPRTVAAIAAAAGEPIQVAAVTAPNFALIDHVKSGNAMSLIRRGGWDVVILQQGPTSTGPSPDLDTLIVATRLLDQEIRAQGGRTALFMVWPARARIQFFDNTRDAYRTAATNVNGLFLPAGEAWRAAWDVEPSLQFYSSDAFHPSPLGSFLAALVIVEGITGKDVRTLPPTALAGAAGLQLAEATVRLLQDAAHQTMVRFRE